MKIFKKITNFLIENKVFLLISTIQFLIIFHGFISKETFLYFGRDMLRNHIPAREYLFTQLRGGEYPFWTERTHLGYPLYADLGIQNLNPINVLLVYFTGPYISTKLLIFTTYLLGSLGLYKIIKDLGGNNLGFFISNLIYFFTFFSIFHMEHLALILTFYLVPLNVYLFSKIGHSLKGVLSYSLLAAYTFYIGSFQMFFLGILLQILYFLIFIYKKHQIYNWFKNYFVSFLIAFILVFPVLLPTTQIFLSSRRSTDFNFLEGSILPINLLSSIFPYLYGQEGFFDGYIFCDNCTIQELYVYFGISAVVFLSLAVIFIKDKKLQRFLFISFLISILLSVLYYLPFSSYFGIGPLGIFRYWNRSLYILIFAVSIFLGIFISKNNLEKPELKNLLKYFLVAVILLLVQLRFWNLHFFKDFIFHMRATLPDRLNFVLTFWFGITASSLLVTTIIFIMKNRYSFIKYLATLVIFIDIVYFSSNAVSLKAYKPFNELPSKSPCLENFVDRFENSRIVDLTGCVNQENAHVLESWSYLGGSQYSPKQYYELIKSVGFDRTRVVTSEIAKIMNDSGNFENLKSIGTEYVIKIDGEVIDLKNPILQEVDILSIIKKEGDINAKIFSDKAKDVNTYIRNYSGWEIFVNGKKTENISNKKDFFLSFYVPAGENQITLKFIPKVFYLGITISGVTLFITLPFIYKKRKMFNNF